MEVSSTKRILETKTPRNPTRKSVPPRTRKRTKSGRVREGQNSRIRRPSKSVYFSIQSLFRIGRFRARAGPGPIWGVFGGSETGRPEGRPERPPRRSTTRSKSTRSSRLCSLSLSSVVSRSVPLRDVCVGKICLASRGRMSFVFGLQRSDYKILFRPLDVLAGPGHAVRRRSRRALTVDARSFTSDRRRIEKPARHRSRSENENFAQS